MQSRTHGNYLQLQTRPNHYSEGLFIKKTIQHLILLRIYKKIY